MFSRNTIELCGKIVRQPRILQVGESKKAEFTVVCTERYKTKDGTLKDRNEFVNCIAWGKQAEQVENFVGEGMQVFVDGSFSTDSWEKDGQKHWKSYCRVREVSVLVVNMQAQENSQPDLPARETQSTLPLDEAPF